MSRLLSSNTLLQRAVALRPVLLGALTAPGLPVRTVGPKRGKKSHGQKCCAAVSDFQSSGGAAPQLLGRVQKRTSGLAIMREAQFCALWDSAMRLPRCLHAWYAPAIWGASAASPPPRLGGGGSSLSGKLVCGPVDHFPNARSSPAWLQIRCISAGLRCLRACTTFLEPSALLDSVWQSEPSSGSAPSLGFTGFFCTAASDPFSVAAAVGQPYHSHLLCPKSSRAATNSVQASPRYLALALFALLAGAVRLYGTCDSLHSWKDTYLTAPASAVPRATLDRGQKKLDRARGLTTFGSSFVQGPSEASSSVSIFEGGRSLDPGCRSRSCAGSLIWGLGDACALP